MKMGASGSTVLAGCVRNQVVNGSGAEKPARESDREAYFADTAGVYYDEQDVTVDAAGHATVICRGKPHPALVGPQSQYRTAQQNHHHLWAQGDPTLQGQVADRHRRSPPAQSGHSQSLRSRFCQQYVRDDRLLRTEPATNNVYDYGVHKNVENLPQLRSRMSEIIDNYQNVQQDILETFVDRGQLRKLAQPTILPSGRRIPGLKLDHPRQLAVMHSLVRFSNLAAGGQFTTTDLYPAALAALGVTQSQYSLASFRYDLSKLRAKGLVERFPHSRRYRLLDKGYSICVLFLKLFEKIYAPLSAGLLTPFRGDRILADEKRCKLDRLYQRISDDLDALFRAVGLKFLA